MSRLTPRSAVIAGALTAAVLGLVWLALADVIVDRDGAPTPLDASVLSFMIAERTALLTVILTVITHAGGTLGMTVVAVAAIGWLGRRRQWSDAVLVAVAGLGASILVTVTKGVVGRIRPPTLDHLVIHTNPAFPSGHSLGSLTVIGVVTAVALSHLPARRTRVTVTCTAVVFVLAVGISRLYLGVHWATDVLGGWLLGGAWLTLCLTLNALPTLRRTRTKTTTPGQVRGGSVR
jgi:undecaprenyl-diphosphatase